jgi:hypothetical protein
MFAVAFGPLLFSIGFGSVQSPLRLQVRELPVWIFRLNDRLEPIVESERGCCFSSSFSLLST